MKKAILVTGATGGLGQVISEELDTKDYQLVLLGSNSAKVQHVAENLNNVISCIEYNLEDLRNIESIFEKCKEQNIILDGMVHCAGINRGMPIKANDIDVEFQMAKVNTAAFVELGKHFCKKKYSSVGSSIVAISSMASINNAKGMGMYSATKAALNSIVQTMAKEFITRKIRVNAILPGYLEHTMRNEILFMSEDKMKEIQPLGLIPYEQVATMVEFLLSEKSNYITGALVPIGGGQV